MAKLLVVDDEQKIREMIRKYAVFEGYDVEEASDGFEAVERCEKENFDLIIMDVMMPDLDGFSAVKAIRRFKNTPVIMLSARGEEYDRIHGFEVGVDDYVVKPFSVKELMMRVSAILARSRAVSQPAADTASFEGLEIDYTARIVKIDGERVEMSPKEYELLFFMSRNCNMALSRETLLTEVWGYDYFGDDRTLDTHIKLLRRSLGEYQKFIVTVRGVGYRFDAQ
ncbi:MAG: response regulator transcription factor [Erysipelotrichaceae bacterium]|nr:response regulator transcription factor [Erysipelotrichaceae bacterium]